MVLSSRPHRRPKTQPFSARPVKRPIYEQILLDKTAVHETLPARFMNYPGFRTFLGSLRIIEANSQIAVCDFGVSLRRRLATSIQAIG
jgi:hypothetical protein